jgi:hypothetical protein
MFCEIVRYLLNLILSYPVTSKASLFVFSSNNNVIKRLIYVRFGHTETTSINDTV